MLSAAGLPTPGSPLELFDLRVDLRRREMLLLMRFKVRGSKKTHNTEQGTDLETGDVFVLQLAEDADLPVKVLLLGCVRHVR